MKGFFLFLLMTVSISVNAQKMVLMEKLTSPFCGECGNAALTLEDITADIPNVIWVSHHKPVGWIENPLMNDQSSALWEELNVFGTPLGMVDRKPLSGSLLLGRGSWRGKIEHELSEPAIVNMDVRDATFDWGTNSVEFTIDATFDALVEEAPYRLTALILEDSVGGVRQHNYYNAVAGHPHEGLGEIIWEYTHRNVTRAILENHWGSTDVIPNYPSIGTTYSKTYSYVVPEGYNRNQMSIVCFVASHDPNNLQNRQVLNAAKFKFPDVGIGLSNVDNVTLGFNVNVFPNPANEVLNIETEELADKISLFDMQGKLVYSVVPTLKVSAIETNKLPKGEYLLSLNFDSKTSNQIVILK